MSEPKNLNIVISGDVVVDNHIIEGSKMFASDKNNGTAILKRVGGAKLTFDLINNTLPVALKQIKKDLKKLQKEKDKLKVEIDKKNIELSQEEIESKKEIIEIIIKKKEKESINLEKKLNKQKEIDKYYSSYLKVSSDTKNVFNVRNVLDSYIKWTLNEKQKLQNPEYIGFGNPVNTDSDSKPTQINKSLNEANLVVIDDANLNFRNTETDFSNKNVILKMSYPFCKGVLWQNLTEKTNNLLTIVNLRNLRRYDAKVSKGISWEQTALDLAFEMVTNIHLKKLLRSKHVIVCIGSAGALYVKNGTDKEKAEFQLVFDPVFMEDEWEEQNGTSVGLGSAFLSGFIRSYINEFYVFNTKEKNKGKDYFADEMDKLIKTGLNYTRTISKSGLLYWNEGKKGINLSEKIEYSIQHLINAGEKNPCFYSTTFVPSPYWKDENNKNHDAEYLKNTHWNILEGNYFPTNDVEKRIRNNKDLLIKIGKEEKELLDENTIPRPYYDLAREVVLKGPSAIQYAPKIQFGGFTSFDRKEIESLRNIRKLMLDYTHDNEIKRPLNIAIFGQPGAGKSFAVKQIAKNAMGAGKIKLLEYNLSQYANANELTGAFHEIRDVALSGELPIVFWDEFDSEELKWLKEFIMPMQDGAFQEAGRTHPLGKCIFFFAGGTGYSYESFNPEFFEDKESKGESDSKKMSESEEKKESNTKKESKKLEEKIYKFRLFKGPDFLSRIDGYLDVLGPNRKEYYNKKTGRWVEDLSDVCFPVRRALFLHGNLKSKNEDSIEMDWGLMSAFLEVGKYIRGSRSFERLLHQLKLYNPSKYVRSNLPSDEVIAMNVDYNEFIGLLYKNREIEKFSEKIAPHIHAAWSEFNVTDSSFFNVYSQLNYEGRKNNISAAIRMFDFVNKTEEYEIVLNDYTKKNAFDEFNEKIGKEEFQKNKTTNEYLDKLAELEHNGWLKDRILAGWKLHNEEEDGKDRNDYFKTHSCMVLYNGDKEKQIEKDKYSGLNEEQKNKDRDSICNYTEFLKDSEFIVVKKTQDNMPPNNK